MGGGKGVLGCMSRNLRIVALGAATRQTHVSQFSVLSNLCSMRPNVGPH